MNGQRDVIVSDNAHAQLQYKTRQAVRPTITGLFRTELPNNTKKKKKKKKRINGEIRFGPAIAGKLEGCICC